MATRAELVQAYLAYFGRPPDFDGLKFYENIPFADVIANFSKSPESTALYGSTFGAAQVNAIYQNLFNRDAEPAGLDYWSGRVNSGALSPAAAAYGIMIGAQNADKTSVDNKIAIINLFESKLDTSAEITGYSGAASAASARAYIKTVDSTAASVTAATTGGDAAVAAAVAQGSSGPTGLTLTLSTSIETSTASANDTVNGVIAAAGGTFQTGDVINAAKAVNVTVTDGTATTATLKSVGTLTTTTLAANTINADLFTGVANIVNDGSAVQTIANGELATVYGVKGTGSITANVRAANVAGTADTLKFSVNGAGSLTGSTAAGFTVISSALASTTTGVETIEVATAGTNIITVTGATTATTDNATLKVTGNGANTITASGLTNTTTFDLSTSTGTNTLNMAGALATGTTVKGGTGADTLRIAPATTTANLTATGVETLRLSTGGTTGSTTFATAPNFTTVRIDGDNAEGVVQTLNTLGAFANLNYVGSGTTATSGAQQQFNGLTVNNSFTGTADTVAIKIGNGGTALTAGIGYAIGALSLGGVETITADIADISGSGVAAFGGITGTTLTSLTVTTAGSATLGTLTSVGTGGTGTLSSLNLAGVTGTGVSTLTLANNTVTASTVITASKGGTTIAGLGAEATADSLVFTGDTGVDTVFGTAFTGTLVLDGKAGADVLTGGEGADTITGGEGADSIIGGKGNDSISLTETVASSDTVHFGRDTAAGNNLTVANQGVETISGFTAGATGGDILSFDIGGVVVTNTTAKIATLSATGATLTSIANAAAAGDVDIVIVLGNHASYAAVQTILNATAGAITDATDGAIVVYRDTSNNTQVYFDTNISAGAGTGTQLATLTGVDTANLVAANFQVLA